MSAALIAVLTVVCMLTYAFEITFGLAGTIMMITIMSFFIDAKTLVIYSLLPQVLVGTIALTRSERTVELRFLAGMVGFAALGSLAGFYVFYNISSELFQVLLATVITLSGTYLVMAPGKLKIGAISGRVLDTAAGTSMALFGISGPIAMTRLMGTFDRKILIRNYALAFFLSMNLVRAVGYISNGTITGEIGRVMLISAPFLIVSLWYANHLHHKVNDTVFKRVVAWVILLGGISMFYTASR
ncbi:sulfite exporter TauE/SafE family protein [Sulfuriflexus mobilis]|uniref:sulfite exporter TauE/SafE family protein n=1 Tax=Sulfuriflexus mobilis TaxID=1811807 RepID=UPI000F847712|nr:sulfite exporter TauE/SafE family protein [Sulfuriflexus mobilis]